jgi:hypothetical protein
MTGLYPRELQPPDPEDQPEPWEIWLANAEPHMLTITDYVGDGPDAEEREIDVEVRGSYPTESQVLG